MGCIHSSLKTKKKKQEDGEEKTKKKGTAGEEARDAESQGDQVAKSDKEDSLEIPVPEEEGAESSKSGQVIVVDVDPRHAARSSRAHSVTADYARAASHASHHAGTPSPKRPQSNVWVYDELMLDGSKSDENSSSSSAPQLFRISPTNRTDVEEGSWRWWMDQIRRERLTRDGFSRGRLQDVQNRLICQHDEEPTDVELDLGRCYMERTAPYVLGKLLSSPTIKEVRWVTSLRLDGNYFTDHGFGNMLATLSQANEARTVMPLLEQLYLNNMNLNRESAVGIFFFLFPVDFQRERKISKRLGPVPEPSMDFAPHTNRPPTVPLFPSLSILSLSDNPGLGTAGIAAMFRWLLATHLEPHVLSALDLSRCGIDRHAERVVGQYFRQLPIAITSGRNPVMPRSLVLLGNRHGIRREEDVNTPEEIRLIL